MVKPTTVRVVLALVVASNWSIRQLDIHNVFLHGDLPDTMYMSQPPRFLHPNFPHHICHLHKALYSLKQAPRAWFHCLSTRLLELGFHASKSDSSLFILLHPSHTIFVLVYVDDIVITGSSASVISTLVTSLSVVFPVKDLGSFSYFLGLEVHHSSFGLLLSQKNYVTDLLTRADMLFAKPVASPMATSTHLSAHTGDPYPDPTHFRSIVGGLQYLSFPKPDLAFAISKVCQYMHSPRMPPW